MASGSQQNDAEQYALPKTVYFGVPNVSPYSLNCIMTCLHCKPVTSPRLFTSGVFTLYVPAL